MHFFSHSSWFIYNRNHSVTKHIIDTVFTFVFVAKFKLFILKGFNLVVGNNNIFCFVIIL